MEQAEFDKFADEYRTLHASNIKLSGESPEFFAEYKIKDVVRELQLDAKKNNLVLPDQPAILDFGAGTGASIPYFRKYFIGARITCLDVSKKSLQIGDERFSTQAEFRHFDGKEIPFEDNTFDIAFAACVFHHIDHSEHLAHLSELHRILKHGGSLFIFEHNPYNPLTLHAVNTCPFDENAVLIRPSSMKRHFRTTGFPNPLIRYRIFFPAILRSLRTLELKMTWLLLGAQYYVWAKKTDQL